MKKAGWDRYYVPEAKVIHYCGGSFQNQDLRRRILSLESRIKFFRKNYSSSENPNLVGTPFNKLDLLLVIMETRFAYRPE